ncbi:hypothetical protein ABU162_04540 [Paenibacillus thiaminolyticus]|uniref:hypothetical protein n=1 Tax=Paenibacillus thiaminolyticus TaxID=49283 RepID=UPI0035A6FBD5
MDWRDDLKSKVDSYLQQRASLSKALGEVLGELKHSPYGYSSTVDFAQISPLSWLIRLNVPGVGRLEFSISTDEILDHQEDEAGYPKSKSLPEDVHEAFRECITRKIDQRLKIS